MDFSLSSKFLLPYLPFSISLWSEVLDTTQLPTRLWLVPALIRGERNGTWLPLLCGWSFPLPGWCWRLRMVSGSKGSPFFTPAWISQAVIVPGGPGKVISHWSHDAHCFKKHLIYRSSGDPFLSHVEQRNGLVFLFEERVRLSCHGMVSADFRLHFECWSFPFKAWN